ncbi:MAG: hypothetical protein GY757_22815, partial [bacterium]|nr:hypothetical protein [bacterium]
MKLNVFDSLLESKKSTKKWLFFPVSLLFHALLVAAVVVVPLLSAGDNFPPAKIQMIMMTSAPAPPPPPPAAAGPKATTRKPRPDRPEREQRPVQTGRIVAPIEVPDEIEEESIEDFEGLEGGLEGGVVGGVEGGVVGGVLGSETSSSAMGPNQAGLTIVEQPRLMRRIAPLYPGIALKARIQGVVTIEALTDIYGKVIRTKVINGHTLLKGAAAQAVK